MSIELTPTQQAAIAAEQTSFLLGPARTGKTATQMVMEMVKFFSRW